MSSKDLEAMYQGFISDLSIMCDEIMDHDPDYNDDLYQRVHDLCIYMEENWDKKD